MKKVNVQRTYVVFLMLITSVFLMTGCDSSDEKALLDAQHDSVLPGACTAAGPKVDLSFLYPTNNLENVSISTTITAHFDEAMKPDTLVVTDSGNPEVLTFTLRDNNDIADTKGTVAMSVLDTVATFTPSAALNAGSWYTVTITTYAESSPSETPLGCSYQWSFKTAE
jgi:hypothetical protein